MFGNMEVQGVHQYIEEYVTKCAYFLGNGRGQGR